MSDMRTFLRSHTPHTILPPSLPHDKDSELNNLLYTDSCTQDLISVMDACPHNGYDVPRARGTERIIQPHLYTSFVEAYLDLALKEPEKRSL